MQHKVNLKHLTQRPTGELFDHRVEKPAGEKLIVAKINSLPLSANPCEH